MNHNITITTLFNDLIGQNTATDFLVSALIQGHIAPSYLFIGPHGVGRKLCAIKFAIGLLYQDNISRDQIERVEKNNHPDLLWIEPTYIHQGQLITKSKAVAENVSRRSKPQIRLEQIREIKVFLGKRPLEGDKHIIILENVEDMAESASNALLKTLEEPFNGVLLLITSRPEKLLSTILSRCQKIHFNYLNQASIKKILAQAKTKEKDLEEKINDINYKELFNLASGSPGALIEHLDIWERMPKDIIVALKEIKKDPLANLSLARQITDLLDNEEQIWLINWYQQYLWNQSKNNKAIFRLEKLRTHLKFYVQPIIAWEIALIEISEICFTQALALSS